MYEYKAGTEPTAEIFSTACTRRPAKPTLALAGIVQSGVAQERGLWLLDRVRDLVFVAIAP